MERRARSSAAVLAAYALVSFLYFGLRVAAHPGRDYVGFGRDPEIFVWALAWWPHAIAHGLNPVVTHLVWAPSGVNLAWTTSVPGLALVLAPLTASAGPVAAYNVAAVLLPALAAWTSFLLCRQVTGALWPSVVGGYLFGFSAYMLGQELGHGHMTAVFLLPLVALVVLRFVEGGLDGRGLAWRLGLLLACQLLLSTEVLLTATLALVVALAVAYGVVPDVRTAVRAALRPLAGAYLLAGVLASPLLVYAVSGFEARSINRPRDFDTDLLNFVVPTRLVAAGAGWAPGIAARFPGNDAERGAYLGVPLAAAVVWYLWRGRRRPGARFLAVSLALAAVASLGTALYLGGHRLVPLPWTLLARLPGLDNVLPSRLAVFTALGAAVVFALWAARAPARVALGVSALAVLALLPRLDIPVWSTHPDRPAFFADGLYRSCLKPGDELLIAPFGGDGDSMLWQAESGFAFRMAEGYLRPAPPETFLRFPAVWLMHFDHAVPSAHDLGALVDAKGITRIVVTAPLNDAWKPSLARYGAPTAIGGVDVYPAC